MTDPFLQILQQHPEISENPQLIKTFPVHLSSLIVEYTKNSVNLIKDPRQSNVVIEALSIHNKFKNNKIMFSDIKDKILLNNAHWVKTEELKSIEDKIFNTNKNIDFSSINENVVYEEIKNIRKMELDAYLEKQGVFSFLLNNDFCSKHIQLSTYLKKLVLDHLSLEMFGKTNTNFVELFSLKRFDQKNNNENTIKSIDNKDVIFSYLNLNKMDIPKIPRFGSVFDSYNISNQKVKGVFHKSLKISVPVVIDSFRTIQIDTDLWCGTIVCEGQ